MTIIYPKVKSETVVRIFFGGGKFNLSVNFIICEVKEEGTCWHFSGQDLQDKLGLFTLKTLQRDF